MDDFRKRFCLYYTDYNRTIILAISGQMLLVVVDHYTSFSLWFIYFPDFFHFFLSSFNNDRVKTGALCFDDKNILTGRSKRQGRTSCFTMNYVTLCNNMQDHSCNTVPYPVAWVGVTAVKLANS